MEKKEKVYYEVALWNIEGASTEGTSHKLIIA